jgi:hypothetical protein
MLSQASASPEINKIDQHATLKTIERMIGFDPYDVPG